ncbi:MAG: phosphotransferase [Spirochaetes bacterium]|nr:phosphotransferase [Spirochaetota bacterium]MBU0955167.1 phosphotransferase [Spirochaetota bacterium]
MMAENTTFTEELIALLAPAFGLDRNGISFLTEGENLIFLYQNDSDRRILRVSGNHDRRRADIEAEMDFMLWLNHCGDVAVRVLPTSEGSCLAELPLEGKTRYAICYEMLERPFPGKQAWDSKMFTRLGERCGQLHQASLQYKPGTTQRYQWHENPDLHYIMSLDGKYRLVAERTQTLVERLRALPADRSKFGLIHADLHCGNMGWDRQGQIRFYDFDDCHYGWFMQDLAVALFFSYWEPDMLGGIMNHSSGDTNHAADFAGSFLAGYRRHASPDSVQLSALGDLLKLQRCLLWGVLHADGENRGEWEQVYQKWQKEIEADLPFVELDFSGF